MKSKVQRVYSAFKSVDLFGEPIVLNIDGKDKQTSPMGGLMTLIMVVLIILALQNQILAFFSKNTLTVTLEQRFYKEPPQINLTQDNFMFALAIQQPEEYPFNERPFFTFDIIQYHYNQTNKTQNNMTLELVPCTIDQFKLFETGNNDESIKQQFEKFSFKNYLCPPDDFVLRLEGAFLSSDFFFVAVKTKPCVNGTRQNGKRLVFKLQNCAPQEAIDNYMYKQGGLRLNFYTSNSVVNPQKSKDFSQIYMSEYLNFVFQPTLMKKEVNVFFSEYQVMTDNSLFIDEQIEENNYIFQQQSEMLSQDLTDIGHFLEKEASPQNLNDVKKVAPLTIYLRSDNFRNTASRKYMKIDELLSYIGGIFHLFVIVFGVLMQFYNKTSLMLRLANKLYAFTEIENKHRHRKRTSNNQYHKVALIIEKGKDRTAQPKGDQGSQNSMSVSYEGAKVRLSDANNQEKINELGFRNRNEFMIWYFQEFFSSRPKLRATLTYFIYTLTCRKCFANEHNELVRQAVHQISKDLNIKHLIDHVNKIEKVKKLIFSRQQRILFDFFPKQELTVQGTDSLQIKKMLTQKQGKISRVTYRSFQRLLSAYEFTSKDYSTDETTQQINNKLIAFLGSELKMIFDTSLQLRPAEDKEGKDVQDPLISVSNAKKKIIKDELKMQDIKVDSPDVPSANEK